MNNAIEIYRNAAKYSTLQVPHYIIIYTILSLADANCKPEALRLIRGAYAREDGEYASLDEATEIYTAITGKE